MVFSWLVGSLNTGIIRANLPTAEKFVSASREQVGSAIFFPPRMQVRCHVTLHIAQAVIEISGCQMPTRGGLTTKKVCGSCTKV